MQWARRIVETMARHGCGAHQAAERVRRDEERRQGHALDERAAMALTYAAVGIDNARPLMRGHRR